MVKDHSATSRLAVVSDNGPWPRVNGSLIDLIET